MLTPGSSIPDVPKPPGADKLVHLGLFMVLAFLWSRVFNDRTDKRIKKSKYIPNFLVVIVVFAILVEYIQRLVPGRSFDYWDILFNILGVTIGAVLFYYLHKRKSKLV
ncbi:VanZ family protein [Litoribacter ruber]|uniref:VanZ family protein n=1 Tax=Litoribacter ruber TaxID=702568 RepID=A0AAP2CEH3_9BACT|nr:VanZ family protein [Litoribacter ruber]MBS9522958.1 VanZ family protein [Litoribacter alkaliphilus]MBT0810878.1 VanZ family protein [Litoribacter ruber]